MREELLDLRQLVQWDLVIVLLGVRVVVNVIGTLKNVAALKQWELAARVAQSRRRFLLHQLALRLLRATSQLTESAVLSRRPAFH